MNILKTFDKYSDGGCIVGKIASFGLPFESMYVGC